MNTEIIRDIYGWNIEEAIEGAKAEGFTVVKTQPHLLLLDLDNREAVDHYKQFLPLVRDKFGLEQLDTWTSKSGEGTHIVLWAEEELTIGTRIALQAVLGSDLKREALALAKLADGVDDPLVSVLFRPPANRPPITTLHQKEQRYASVVEEDDIPF